MRCFIFNNMNITLGLVLTRYLRKFKHRRTKLSIKSVHSTDDFFWAKKICFPNFLLRAKEFHVCVQQRLFAILLRFTISYSPPTVIRMINYSLYPRYPKIRKFGTVIIVHSLLFLCK